MAGIVRVAQTQPRAVSRLYPRRRSRGASTIRAVATGGGESVAGVPINAGNWQLPPFNRWAYWHVKDVLPTRPIPRGSGPIRELPAATGRPSDVELTEIHFTRGDGSFATVAQVLADTYTDAYVVLQDGALVTEWYGSEGAPDRTHALMS